VFELVEDYPRTLTEFDDRFGTGEACRKYLIKLRWPDGFFCPACGQRKAWQVRARPILFHCASCGKQTSVTAGTIFQDTRTPLRTWFHAMWWLTSQKTDASAMSLQRVLGLGSYKTAWTLLHKLRRAMVRPGRDQLSGTVEVDETYLGAPEKGVRGRQTRKKALIAIATEEDGTGIERIRMRKIPDASADSLQTFVEWAVTPGSVILTDGLISYDRIEKHGYGHQIVFLKGKKKSAAELLPRVHRVASLLKRWLIGTHQGAVSQAHLDYYLDEFTFRFNRRTSRHRGKLFYRLAQQAVEVDPAPFPSLVKHVRGQRRSRK
jgi:transposase-like protein